MTPAERRHTVALEPIRIACSVLGLLLVVGCATVPPRVALPDATSPRPAPHADLDAFLARHVVAGRVDYAAAAGDRADLDRYVAWTAAVSPDNHPERFPTRQDELAYWINAYNAAVLHLVLDRYPIRTVKDVRPPAALFFAPRLSGFFVFQRVTLGGRDVNLYDLEHDIIRARYGEPRIHFAINCASISCPRLPSRAFFPEELESQLANETARFVADSQNVAIEPSAGRIRLSALFDWYESDYTDWLARERPEVEPSVLSYVALYAERSQRAALDACADCEVSFFDYDWGLNDAR